MCFVASAEAGTTQGLVYLKYPPDANHDLFSRYSYYCTRHFFPFTTCGEAVGSLQGSVRTPVVLRTPAPPPAPLTLTNPRRCREHFLLGTSTSASDCLVLSWAQGGEQPTQRGHMAPAAVEDCGLASRARSVSDTKHCH